MEHQQTQNNIENNNLLRAMNNAKIRKQEQSKLDSTNVFFSNFSEYLIAPCFDTM